jgi:cell division protein FtsZ
MAINFSAPEQNEQLKPRITVIGVGGAGGNAVNNMISQKLEGVEFVVGNTDAQALAQSLAEKRVQLGRAITHGLGAGSRPDMGRAAAEEAMEDINQHLCGSHMVFIAAGMGGGTGTGAAPVIARLAREQGMLTVGVVTKPFQFEGRNRMRIADEGIEEMQQYVDTLIVIPNQNLFRIANEKTTFADAFAMADDVLHSGVRGVTDLMVVPGLINLDFADIRSVMSEMGKAMMGTGESEGEDRARLAAEAAISNPLLDDVSMKGARGVLINITGGPDMTLFEVDEAANRIGEEVDPQANIIFGSALDPSLEGKIRVSVVATGIDIEASAQPKPILQIYSDNPAPQPMLAEARNSIPVSTPVMAANPAPQPTLATQGATMGVAAIASMPAPAEIEQPVIAEAVQPMESSRTVLPDPAIEPPIKMAADEVWKREEEARAAATIEIEEPRIGSSLEAETIPPMAEAKPFIPPAPVKAPESLDEGVTTADPFREAEMLNAVPAVEKKRSSNLFQRMTGTSWPRRDTADKVKPAEATAARVDPPKWESQTVPKTANHGAHIVAAAAEVPRAMPAIPAIPAMPPMPAPAPIVIPEPAKPVSVDSQPRLSGVDPQDRLPSSQSEEDLLDIPAFLRRQAN